MGDIPSSLSLSLSVSGSFPFSFSCSLLWVFSEVFLWGSSLHRNKYELVEALILNGKPTQEGHILQLKERISGRISRRAALTALSPPASGPISSKGIEISCIRGS